MRHSSVADSSRNGTGDGALDTPGEYATSKQSPHAASGGSDADSGFGLPTGGRCMRVRGPLTPVAGECAKPLSVGVAHTLGQYATATGTASVHRILRPEARVGRVGAGRGEGIPFIPTAPPHPAPQ